MSLIPTGAYINNVLPWWSQDIFGTPANIEVSTLTVNPLPAGNILLQHTVSSGTEYNAPLIFQRPPADINAPSESLVMNTSIGVPTKPVDGEYITATKAAGTVYDDIAVAGLQVYGDQTTAGNTGAAAYITGSNGNLILAAQDSVYVSSLFVSTLTATNVVSTTATTGTSLTLTSFLSSLSATTGTLSTNSISTSQIVSKDIFTSTLSVSTLNAPNFVVSTLSTVSIDTKVTLTSTLTLLGVSSVNLGLGDVIQGLIGGAASQGLGAVLGGAALATGAAALITARTSGGVNSNIFQTVNGSTQLQFSTIGSNVSSVFLTTNSPDPFTTPGLEISTTQSVAAGTYCVRSVGDPLYINNNVSSIQMFGQWVPVIQPTATLPAVAVSSFFVSSVNGAVYPPPGTSGIPSTLNASTINVNGNLTQSGTGTFNWGGNTMSGTQVVLNRPTSVNATLTTSGTAFLNAGAIVNNGLTVGGTASFNNQVNMGQNAAVNGSFSVNNGTNLYGGLNVVSGNLTLNQFGAIVGASVIAASLNMRSPAISTNQISTANINVSSVNGATYPPPGGGGIPSTLNASTLTVNGGQTITNGGLVVSGGNVTIQNPATLNNSLTVLGQTFAVGGLVVEPPGAIFNGAIGATTTIQVAGLATLNGGVITPALSTNTISTAGLLVSSINNTAYPPPVPGIPSTLNASTINVNGGINIANGGIINNSFEPIRTGFLSTNQISTGLIRADTVQAPIFNTNTLSTNVVRAAAVSTIFLSSQTITAAAVSTIFISSQTITASNAGLFQISSLTGSIYTLLVDGGSAGRQGLVFMDALSAGNNPAGNIKAVGNGITTFIDPVTTSYTIQNGYTLGLNKIATFFGQNSGSLAGSAQFFSTLTVCDNVVTSPTEACIQTYPPTAPAPVGTVITKAVSTQSILVSSINNTTYPPPPPPPSPPTGSVIIWGGITVASLPAGWLICDGSLVLKTTYAALFSVIGNSYYNGGLSPTPIDPNFFNLPDLTFAIPQGAPTPTYQCRVSVATYPFPVVGFPPVVSSNSYWSLVGNGSFTSGTINVGTYFPPGSVPGAPVGTGYRISRVLDLGFDGNPNLIEVIADNNSVVPFISTPTTISSIGVYSANGASPVKYWRPGTFNDNYQGDPPTTPLEAPTRNVYRQLDATNIPAHQHVGVPNTTSSAIPGSGFAVGNGGSTAIQTGATQLNSTPSTAPYPTHPHVLNMFYIIRT